ncbi:gas vesicle protein [Streptomyces sp. RFCAC02]|uniref:gas vesicle protein n=1 Tax=Streptomyces sp. RFCAC02 TaxID=2499143 RepID=UPI001021A84C|nr:gas vesicle protein [Streptomyces sp. RFCAC02]
MTAPVPDVFDAAAGGQPLAQRQIALVDLLDRLLAGGVVLTGHLTLSIADVDLVHIDLKALISSVKEGGGV